MNTDIFLNSSTPQELPAANADKATHEVNQSEDRREKFDSILKSQNQNATENKRVHETRPQNTERNKNINKERNVGENTAKQEEINQAPDNNEPSDVDVETSPTEVIGNTITYKQSEILQLKQETSTSSVTVGVAIQDILTTQNSTAGTEEAQISALNPAIKEGDSSQLYTANNSSIAGSIVSQSVNSIVKNQTLSDFGFEMVESEEQSWSGKLFPPNGKSSPLNQPSISSAEYQKNTLLDSSSFDTQNKTLSFNQQLIAGETSSLFSQTSTASTSSEESELTSITNNLIATANPSTSEKLMTSKSVAPPPTFNIEAPFGSNEWHSQVNNRIRWLGKLNIPSAELQLHPAELGAIEVKITTENDQTKVSFFSNNQVTREMIESSIPRLRELLSDSGLQLEQSDVSEQTLADNTEKHASDSQKNLTSSQRDSDNINELNQSRISRFSHNQVNHYV